MRLLLDTHVLLWALTTPTKLPARIAAEIVHPRNAVFVSPVSTWEVAIKTSLGKLDASVRHVLSAIERTGFEELPVRFAQRWRSRNSLASTTTPLIDCSSRKPWMRA